VNKGTEDNTQDVDRIIVTTADGATHAAESFIPYASDRGTSAAAEGKDWTVVQGYDLVVIKLKTSYAPKKPVCLARRPQSSFDLPISHLGFGGDRWDVDLFGQTSVVGVGRFKTSRCEAMPGIKHSETFKCSSSGVTSDDNVCGGDSGGPAVADPESDTVQMLGVTSGKWGTCGQLNSHNRYVDTTRYEIRKWIQTYAPSFFFCM